MAGEATHRERRRGRGLGIGKSEAELAADEHEVGKVGGERLRIVACDEAGAAFEERVAGEVVKVAGEADAGVAVFEEAAGDGLRDDPVLAAHLGQVQVAHAMGGEQPRVAAGESRAQGDVLEVGEAGLRRRVDRGRLEDMRGEELPRDEAGGGFDAPVLPTVSAISASIRVSGRRSARTSRRQVTACSAQ